MAYLCGICGGTSDSGTRSSTTTSVFPFHYHLTNAPCSHSVHLAATEHNHTNSQLYYIKTPIRKKVSLIQTIYVLSKTGTDLSHTNSFNVRRSRMTN